MMNLGWSFDNTNGGGIPRMRSVGNTHGITFLGFRLAESYKQCQAYTTMLSRGPESITTWVSDLTRVRRVRC
jgi:hypothetical protein